MNSCPAGDFEWLRFVDNGQLMVSIVDSWLILVDQCLVIVSNDRECIIHKIKILSYIADLSKIVRNRLQVIKGRSVCQCTTNGLASAVGPLYHPVPLPCPIMSHPFVGWYPSPHLPRPKCVDSSASLRGDGFQGPKSFDLFAADAGDFGRAGLAHPDRKSVV